MGAGSTGLFIAQKLERLHMSVKLVDRNRKRCEEVAKVLEKTQVICRDPTTIDAMKEERIDSSQVFIAATGEDDRNILAAVLAKEAGVERALAVVEQPDFAPLVHKLGVDHALIPRAIFSQRILGMTLQREVVSRTVLEDEQAEIVEFVVRKGAAVTDLALKDIHFPRGSLVAAIVRGQKVIVPSGLDVISSKDHVVVIATEQVVQDVMKLFSAEI
jgi:trk system potassium uptake protein TrkA